MEQKESTGILVTGGTGFIGSHLVELLLRRGYSVSCLVRDPDRLRWLKGTKVDLFRGDCSDPDTLPSALRGISIVIHAAGLTKARHPRDYYRVNHLGTQNILHASARAGVRKFVLLSSLAAAGPSPNGVPIRETDVPAPVSDYGRSKLLAEEEAHRYRDRFQVVILRPSAVYGPRDTDMYELFRWASRGLTLEIRGGDRYIGPCYVEDVAVAVLRAVERDPQSGSTYFVAGEKPYSWSDFRTVLLRTGGVKAVNLTVPYSIAYLIGLISELGSMVTGKPALTGRQKVLEAVQRYWICDTSRARTELGFQPGYDLETGLKATWRWYRQNKWL